MKKDQTPRKKPGNPQTEKQQADYIEPTEDCISNDCFDLGGQKTFVQAFDVNQMRLPSNRLEQWVAERLVTATHVDADWWELLTGSKEVRPLIMSLRRKHWPIDDQWVDSPTHKLPGRRIKHWYIQGEFRIGIFRRMDAAGLIQKAKARANRATKQRRTARKG